MISSDPTPRHHRDDIPRQTAADEWRYQLGLPPYEYELRPWVHKVMDAWRRRRAR